jgi:GTP 3',8-cyclase
MNSINHLRISVTQRCNIQCFYCHHEGQEQVSKEMTPDEIYIRVKDMALLGIEYVKITGGEPLLRKDIMDVITKIRSVPEIKEISMTSNGFLLKELAYSLKKAGLDRINVGCDALYSNELPKSMDIILPGIQQALLAGLQPIKVNMVVLKGLNDHEIPTMIQHASQVGFILQLIELIPNGDPSFDQYHLSLDNIEKDLEKRADKVMVRSLQGRKQFHLGNAIIEIVGPTQSGFCQGCKKIRITSDGMIKPCLMRSDNLIPYTGIESIKNALSLKAPYHTR